ncbi:MAG: AAA family ATPase [Myxococcota bacterium]
MGESRHGPRGTGKSTWAREHLPGATWVNLLGPDSFRLYSARPERLRELVHGQPAKGTFVIDEVQKLPQLLDSVHVLMEEQRGRRFILTGESPACQLRSSSPKSFPARTFRKRLPPPKQSAATLRAPRPVGWMRALKRLLSIASF